MTGAVTGEAGYLALLRRVLAEGQRRPTRAVLASTGRAVDALTVWAPDPLRFDLATGFPALTTKRVNIAGVAAELLWFLSGSTDVRDLEAMGSRIWSAWANPDGSVGPSYGHNWRRFGETPDRPGVDQVAALVGNIRRVARFGHSESAARRLMLTTLDPATAWAAALYPCHVLAQWDVGEDGVLSCQVYQRSADLFLGVPWNIASYALLTHLLAEVTGLTVGTLTLVLGDAHVYVNHVDQVREQLTREVRRPPTLALPFVRWDWPQHGQVPQFLTSTARPLAPGDVALQCYDPHPALPGEVAV